MTPPDAIGAAVATSGVGVGAATPDPTATETLRGLVDRLLSLLTDPAPPSGPDSANPAPPRLRPDGPTPAATGRLDLTPVSPPARALLDGLLGRGEVTGQVRKPDGTRVDLYETTLPGLWRLTAQTPAAPDPGQWTHWIEVADLPRCVVEVAAAGGRLADLVAGLAAPDRPVPTPTPPAPSADAAAAPACRSCGDDDALSAPLRALLAELAHHIATHPNQPDRGNPVMPLSDLPLVPADRARLRRLLGRGTVQLSTRGYGRCEIQATAWANLWALRYLNASDIPLYETLEIGHSPTPARAPAEDRAGVPARLISLRDTCL